MHRQRKARKRRAIPHPDRPTHSLFTKLTELPRLS